MYIYTPQNVAFETIQAIKIEQSKTNRTHFLIDNYQYRLPTYRYMATRKARNNPSIDGKVVQQRSDDYFTLPAVKKEVPKIENSRLLNVCYCWVRLSCTGHMQPYWRDDGHTHGCQKIQERLPLVHTTTNNINWPISLCQFSRRRRYVR